MKAILFPNYGSPDVLQLAEVATPEPNENQVLVKVVAAAVNPLDWHRMRGEPFIARMGEGFRHAGGIRAGQKVLVNGAAGGIGTFAVQYAKSCGAEVTGVCSTRNLELIRSIGADHVIDYTREDFTRTGKQYDLIYCAIGNRTVFDYRRTLKPHGICVIAGFTSLPLLFSNMILGPLVSKRGDKTVDGMGMSNANKEDLLLIKELLETGKVVPFIDRCYTLNKTAEAIRYLETLHARGKVIINIEPTASY